MTSLYLSFDSGATHPFGSAGSRLRPAKTVHSCSDTFSLKWVVSAMENNQEHSQSHKQREAQTLVDRIEKKDAAHEAANQTAREAETRRTLDDYRKRVGS
jgi:hypothetical protein